MKTKWWKKACMGLFVVAMLMNLTVYFDSAGERSSDLNLGNLNVNLFQKAYGYTIEVPGICLESPYDECEFYLENGILIIDDYKRVL